MPLARTPRQPRPARHRTGFAASPAASGDYSGCLRASERFGLPGPWRFATVRAAMCRPLVTAIACCLLLAAGQVANGQFIEGPSLIEGTLLEQASLTLRPQEAIAAGPAVPVDEHQVILADPGWHVWTPSFWDPWEGNVELGLSGTEGNSETFNVRFGMTAIHKTDRLVQTLQVTSIQKSAAGITTA